MKINKIFSTILLITLVSQTGVSLVSAAEVSDTSIESSISKSQVDESQKVVSGINNALDTIKGMDTSKEQSESNSGSYSTTQGPAKAQSQKSDSVQNSKDGSSEAQSVAVAGIDVKDTNGNPLAIPNFPSNVHEKGDGTWSLDMTGFVNDVKVGNKNYKLKTDEIKLDTASKQPSFDANDKKITGVDPASSTRLQLTYEEEVAAQPGKLTTRYYFKDGANNTSPIPGMSDDTITNPRGTKANKWFANFKAIPGYVFDKAVVSSDDISAADVHENFGERLVTGKYVNNKDITVTFVYKKVTAKVNFEYLVDEGNGKTTPITGHKGLLKSKSGADDSDWISIAPDIKGYKFERTDNNGTESKSKIAKGKYGSTDQKVKFIYTKDSDNPTNPEEKGTVTAEYVYKDSKGTEHKIDDGRLDVTKTGEVGKILVVGGKDIDGYKFDSVDLSKTKDAKKINNSDKAIRVTVSDKAQTVKFIYSKNDDVNPTEEAKVNINFVDESGKELIKPMHETFQNGDNFEFYVRYPGYKIIEIQNPDKVKINDQTTDATGKTTVKAGPVEGGKTYNLTVVLGKDDLNSGNDTSNKKPSTGINGNESHVNSKGSSSARTPESGTNAASGAGYDYNGKSLPRTGDNISLVALAFGLILAAIGTAIPMSRKNK